MLGGAAPAFHARRVSSPHTASSPTLTLTLTPTPTPTPQKDPWFLEALPPEALTMNSRYLAAPPATEQPEAEISAVLAAAGASDAPRSPASEGPAD
jgi:hypothetical protein